MRLSQLIAVSFVIVPLQTLMLFGNLISKIIGTALLYVFCVVVVIEALELKSDIENLKVSKNDKIKR